MALIHKSRGKDVGLTYCHLPIEDLPKGAFVRLRWRGVTCRNCSRFRKVSHARDKVEREYWKNKNNVRKDLEKKTKLAAVLAEIEVHGVHFNNDEKTLCGEKITRNIRLMKFPRITCESCLKVRRVLVPKKEQEVDYDIELDDKRLLKIFKDKNIQEEE